MRLQNKWIGFGVLAALLVETAAWGVSGISGRDGPASRNIVDAAVSTAVLRGTPVAAEADHPPVQPSPQAEAEIWSEAEVAAAREECARLLPHTGDSIEISKP